MSARFQHRVRYHEVDQQGYLFNGRYFEISDVAMTEFFRALGWQYSELNALGVDPSVVHVDADFIAPARFDDLLDVRIDCTRVGTSSFTLRTYMHRETVRIAEVSTVYVNVNAVESASLPLPEDIRLALRTALVPITPTEEDLA